MRPADRLCDTNNRPAGYLCAAKLCICTARGLADDCRLQDCSRQGQRQGAGPGVGGGAVQLAVGRRSCGSGSRAGTARWGGVAPMTHTRCGTLQKTDHPAVRRRPELPAAGPRQTRAQTAHRGPPSWYQCMEKACKQGGASIRMCMHVGARCHAPWQGRPVNTPLLCP